MLATDPRRARARKYVLVFVSDSVAEPRCNAGCEDDKAACSDMDDNDGDGLVDASDPDCANINDNSIHPDNLYGVCNTTQEVPDDVYVDYDGICPAYNQPDQILFRVAQLQNLADEYGVGQLTLHTVLLFAPQDVVEARCPGASASFGYNGGPARALLQAMAQQGDGTFRDVNLATTNTGFFDFDFTGLESQQWLTRFGAVNTNARRAANGDLVPDSDGDGLDDAEETLLGTDDTRRESDGPDNYGDLFEHRMAAAGFDPLDAALPAAPCDDGTDLDGDGLTGCEEVYLGTRVRSPDSDGDGMLDGAELVNGTNPAVADSEPDPDFDQIPSGEELLAATDPLVADGQLYRDERIRYAMTDLGAIEVTRDNGTETRHCYDFVASHIGLTTPLHATPRGRNRVIVQALERPVLLSGVEARVHVACVDAIYQGPNAADEKVPEDGIVDWSAAGWAASRTAVYKQIESIAFCDPDSPGVDGYRRDNMNALIDKCLPVRVEIDKTLYKRDDLKALVQELLHSTLLFRTPDDPSALFVPIESFDPDKDCYRPGRVAVLKKLLGVLQTECAPCPEGTVLPSDEPPDEATTPGP
ncbi:MAG: hypothetical protein U1F43_13625 [Myxococcota bacterium]